MNRAFLLRLIWLLAGLAIVLAWVREPAVRFIQSAKVLDRANAVTPAAGDAWITGGFRANGTYTTTTAERMPPQVPRVGSWLDTDAWQGRAESSWFVPSPLVCVGVAGYPKFEGCSLWVEFRSHDGTVTRYDWPRGNPAEEWTVWEIPRPAGATAVRIVAEDRSTTAGGWVAFSHPFRIPWPAATAIYLFAQILSTVALAFTLLWGPGLLAMRRFAAAEIRLAVLLGAGPLLLVLFGIAIWALGPWLPRQLFGTALVGATWLALARAAWRRDSLVLPGASSTLFPRALAISALLVVAAVAKSSHSVGPQGELFQGTVSRNLALSDRIDSRFNYYTVQVAAHGYTPASPETEKFFYPWTFFSRGPLAGLATIPIVMATRGEPSAIMPDHRWSPFDRTGFTAYRITMIALASSVIVALFLMLAPLVGERWAFVAAGLLALSPFGVHEVMFTWPKWTATAWVIAAFAFAHARRPMLSGVSLGVGFLFHPLALLWAPWIGLWAGGCAFNHTAVRKFPALLAAGLYCTLGACALVVPWMALGSWMPHLPDTPFAGQGGFMKYWVQADWHPATWDTWWRSRWMNFANTFIPLHLVFDPASFNHPKLGSAHEVSGSFVKFGQVWWNSLPFALGLGLWLASIVAVLRGLRSFVAVTWLFVLLPALFIVAYWGADPLGLMRECGHPFFVALIALTCVVAARLGGRLEAILLHRVTPWLQLPETLLMLWLTTLLNPSPRPVDHPQLDPLYLAMNALALLLIARVLSQARAAPSA